MYLMRFVKWMMFVTVLAVVYINMQMQIIELAYRGKAKEKQVRKLIENNGYLTSSILTLKSSNHLGDKLLAENQNMHFLAPESIVKIHVKGIAQSQIQKNLEEKSSQNVRALLSMLPFGVEAHAGGGQ